jgi:hypothetical protein
MSTGILLTAEGFATVMQAAVPRVNAEAPPAVTSAPSHFNLRRKILAGGLLAQANRMLRCLGNRSLHLPRHNACCQEV